jgi:hypothetical protein
MIFLLDRRVSSLGGICLFSSFSCDDLVRNDDGASADGDTSGGAWDAARCAFLVVAAIACGE